MPRNIEIVQQENPAEEEAAFISQQFQAYNASQCGEFPSREIHLFAYGLDRQIIAGRQVLCSGAGCILIPSGWLSHFGKTELGRL